MKSKSYLIFPRAIRKYKLDKHNDIHNITKREYNSNVQWYEDDFWRDLHAINFELDCEGAPVDIEYQNFETLQLEPTNCERRALHPLIKNAIKHGLNVGENRHTRFYVLDDYKREGAGNVS